MFIEWTKHIKDPIEKDKFIKEILSARSVLDRLVDIISEKETTIDRTETSIQVYENPNWSFRQAHKNGNRESLGFLKKLVDLDQQRGN